MRYFDEFPGARAALAQLKQWGTVWVLSDTDPLHIEWVRREFSWALEVEQVLTSYERGKMKSDPGVLRQLSRSQALHRSEYCSLTIWRKIVKPRTKRG
ncbi:MAG: HAD family hydrolase [bacterium]|nr:HAD family hydrolase [bacterium]